MGTERICANCIYYVNRPDKHENFGDCLNSLVIEHETGDNKADPRGLWSFENLEIGKYFGCIHWEGK